NLRIGVRHREHDGIARHALDVAHGEDPRHAQADEDVGSLQGVAESALDVPGVRRRGDPAFHEVHPGGPAPVDRAVLIDADDVADAAREQNLDGRRRGGADARHDDGELPEVLSYDAQGVEQCRQHDDRGPVLVIVEDGDVEILAQALLDLETSGCGDVFQVDAAEGRRQELDRFHDLVGILRGQAHREGVHAGELLEQHRLAFHDGQRRLGSDVAEPQHGGAIGDDCDRVVLHGEGEGALAVVVDRQAYAGHPWRVGHGKVVTRPDGNLAPDLDLSSEVHQEGRARTVDDATAGHPSEPRDDLLAVNAAPRVDGDVADDAITQRLHEVDRADVAASVPDGGGHPSQHARAISDFYPQ